MFGSNGFVQKAGCVQKLNSVFKKSKPTFRDHHKRSNSETVFHMIKTKFGENIQSRKHRSQLNEALLKILCHNITVTAHQTHINNINIENC